MRPYVLGVIPARGGSKGVPRKNIRLLAGKPLIAYTIDAALKAKMLDRVIVSTDDEEIARISRKYRAEVPFIRPKNLSGDSTPMLSVLRHAMEYLGRKEERYADVLVSLQPTSPFRNAYSIDEAVEKLVQKGFDTIVSLCRVDHHPFWMKKIKEDRVYPFLSQTTNYVTRQGLPPLYRLNGSIYVTTGNMLMKEGKKRASYATQLQSEKVGAIILDGEQCLDIDTIVDFALAETIIKKLVRNEKNNEINVERRLLGKNQPVFIIGEAGVNHNGDINLARKLVDAAKNAGVDAVKFQTFKAEDVVTKNADMAKYQEVNLKKKESQLKMLKKLELGYEDFVELKKYCDKKKIIFLSTPHSEDAVEFLDLLVPLYKIGSPDLTNLPFLEAVAKRNKPIILSTGMSTMEEIKEAVQVIKGQGNKQIILLHCTMNYPCPLADVNLKAMQTMGKELNSLVGYSDHTSGILASLMAVGLGACVIEKHFTLDKGLPGPDHKASLEPDELKEMVKMIRDVENLLGSEIKKPTQSEEEIKRLMRKSIVSKMDLPQETIITESMLITKRPGTGINPKYLKQLVGKRVAKKIEKDEMIHWDDIEGI